MNSSEKLLKNCSKRKKLLEVARTEKSCSRRKKLLKSCRAQLTQILHKIAGSWFWLVTTELNGFTDWLDININDRWTLIFKIEIIFSWHFSLYWRMGFWIYFLLIQHMFEWAVCQMFFWININEYMYDIQYIVRGWEKGVWITFHNEKSFHDSHVLKKQFHGKLDSHKII